MEEIIKQLAQGGGNTWIILAVVLFMLFKDKLPWFKPATPPVAPPAPAPAPTDPPLPVTPVERPLIDAFIKLLPVVLPLLIKAAKDAENKPAEPPK